MDDKRFESLISRLEITARDHPRRYVTSVLAVAMLGFGVLGFAVLYALAPAVLLGALALAVVVTGGKALILLLKLGKLLLLLVIPAWVMIKSSLQMLTARFPRPEGRELQAAEAPALFRRLEELRARYRGPRIHKVLLTDELNAAIAQHPRFGLFGWEENYLILGLPYLQIMGEEEAFSVIAHEYGHLSGQHGRLAGFIYRFRSAWGRMQSLSEQWTDWGSRAVARLFRWYAPYFNAYTFVLARQGEYVADRLAAEVAGAEHAGNALMRGTIAAHFEHEVFWPEVGRLVADHPQPIEGRSAFWTTTIAEKLDEAARRAYLDAARDEQTGYLDTHPALSDRLSAIGVASDGDAARRLAPPARSAAQAWLGATLSAVQDEFDTAWQEGAAERWQARHQHLRECREGLAALQAKDSLTVAERWQALEYRRELDPEADPVPALDAILEQMPDHASALYRRGTTLLARGDEAGITDLERLMEKDAASILAACEHAWRYYQERAPEKAEQYRQRWLARSEYEERVEAESRKLDAEATLAPHDLSAETVEQVATLVRDHGRHIKRAWLLRRVFKADASLHDYVLAFELEGLAFGDKAQEAVHALAQQEFPVKCFVVYLGSKTYKPFRKRIQALGIAPLA